MAVIWVSLLTVKLVAFAPPRVTAVAPVKEAPEMTMLVPPFVVPDDGLTVEIVDMDCVVKAARPSRAVGTKLSE